MSDPTENEQARDREKTVAEEVIPIVEERVVAGTRTIEGRTIKVTTRPVTDKVSISEPVRSETVSVERVPVDRIIEAVPEIREDGDLTIIPVVEERVTVTVDLVLKEEIHVRRVTTQSQHEQTVEITRTEVDIDE